ncbi:TraR/DksA family transcriptional regulator [Leptospira gomenensis]|uniref:Molecular chaperone DnaK n=2 Tax=Leptospira TaxID=171 RepID=A0A2N0BD16_9LEPT|nr:MULTISPECIES: TraR/DksA family transcriptional regulator [Leptospira]MDV6237353.1 TraR/DksA family transcriptional regulator [Leptospira ellisii]PJZ94438.1 molecular chaperone DnaK [Leptospira ellisii]PKA04343.1 molecular chaperone DnaK [Leptospira ellisii]TGK33848.1 TraR/DksA family transcriptional regulator [Leptospira gomenensis]TGK36302.1 TraR/DksA family transcriptional regulator [Leptospira gomenensis]
MTAKKQTQAYDKKVLQEIKDLLLERKNSLLEKYAHWEDNSKPSGLKEMGDIADIASEINEETLSSVLSEAEIETIREIDVALEKIEDGSYGICEGTGKKIPIARLKAIPWTRYTVEFAETLSKSKSFARKNSAAASLTGAYKIPSDMDSMDD